MKHSFKTVFAAILILSMLPASPVFADIIYGTKAVERIQIRANGEAYFRPENLTTWDGDQCNPTYAYILKTIPAYQEILSLVMASKLNGSKVYLQGTCDASGFYFLIDYAFLI